MAGMLEREEGKSYSGEDGQDGRGEVWPSSDSALWGNKERDGVSRDGSVRTNRAVAELVHMLSISVPIAVIKHHVQSNLGS